MTTLLPKTKQPRRKNRIVMWSAELFRWPRDPAWYCVIRRPGGRKTILDTGTTHEAAAREFATAYIREITRQQPAASSQQPAASSQQPALI